MPKLNKATAADVAKVAGVSTATVSRALQAGGVITPETRNKVLAAVASLGYQPNGIARGLAAQQNNLIGLVAGDLTNPFYPEVIERLTKSLAEAGFHTIFVSMIDGVPLEETLSPLLQYRVQAAIFVAATLTSSGCQLCIENGIRPFLFNRRIKSKDIISIACDNYEGGKLVANLLLDAGHKQLAYIGGRLDTSTNTERLAGFSDAIAARKGKACFTNHGGLFSYEAGYTTALRSMAEHPKIDAIFCANDIIALGVIDALKHKLKLNIPEDVSVVGFDDISSAAWAAYDLTTVRQPLDTMIAAIVSAVRLSISSNQEQKSSSLLFPGTLITRSTARLREVSNGNTK